jgi:hypothetical protein
VGLKAEREQFRLRVSFGLTILDLKFGSNCLTSITARSGFFLEPKDRCINNSLALL